MFYNITVSKHGTSHNVSFVDSYELEPLIQGSLADGYVIDSIEPIVKSVPPIFVGFKN